MVRLALFGDVVLRWIVESRMPADVPVQSPAMLNFFFDDVRRMAAGLAPNAEPNEAMDAAAELWRRLDAIGTVAFIVGSLALAAAGVAIGLGRIEQNFRARNRVENWVSAALLLTAAVSILTTAGIVFSVLFRSIRFFERVPIANFLFGLEWSPQTAIRETRSPRRQLRRGAAVHRHAADHLHRDVGCRADRPLVCDLPVGVRPDHFRATAKPIMEILAGVPTVVYGFFAALTVAPFIRDLGRSIGLNVASESALAAGVVMGIMIIPFVSSLSDDALRAVPLTLREASAARRDTLETIGR